MRRAALCLLLAGGLAACEWPSASLPPSVTTFGVVPVFPATTPDVRLLVLAPGGAPAAAAVDVVLDTSAVRLGMGLATSPGGLTSDSIRVMSDGNGIAAFALHFGVRTGTVSLRVHAPQIAVDETLTYVLENGTVADLEMGPITPPLVGESLTVVWGAFDAQGNRVFADPVFDVADPAVATVVADERLVALATGYTWVRGQAGGVRDSVPLAVVPPGAFGALSGGQWSVWPLDGSVSLGGFMPPGGFGGPRYSASRDTLAWGDGATVRMRLPGGSIVGLSAAALGFLTVGDPEWSRDGQWLYVTATHADQRREIWRVHPDGSGASLAGPAATGTDRDAMPAVNSAGTALAFSTNRTLDGGQPTLRIVSLPSGATIYTGPSGTRPRYAPNDARIAFLSGSRLMLVNADGTGLRQLTALDQFAGQLSWSPDSRWLLVRRGGTAGTPIYLYLIDTTNDSAIRLPYSLGWTEPEWR